MQHTRDKSSVWIARHDDAVRCASWSPCGRKVATCAGNEAYSWASEITAYLGHFQHTSMSFLRKFLGHTSNVTAASISVDGIHLLTASEDQTARLWNMHSGRC